MLKTRTAQRAGRARRAAGRPGQPAFRRLSEGEEQLERVYEEYFRRVGRAYDPVGAMPVPETYE